LAKAILSKRSPPIGLTQNPQGQLAKTGKESIQNLILTHFPGSTSQPKQTPPTFSSTKTSHKPEWITPQTVQATIHSFKQDKAAGSDNIKVRALKKLPIQIYTILAKIYNSSLELGYMPEVWHESRVIFIPKTGKTDMQNPKSYHPFASLTFYSKLLKTNFTKT
jgi:hypothetical protein